MTLSSNTHNQCFSLVPTLGAAFKQGLENNENQQILSSEESLEEVNNTISISPNPSTGSFIVSSNLNTLKNVEVYDVSGRLLSSTQNQNDEKQIKVENLQLKAGVYWVKSTNTKGETTINKLLITN
ncbi:MAG: T9SS type A sorting domain-containing protein [Bacteroidota bacterium]